MTAVQAKKNSREKRKQAEQEYRARRERSEDKYNIDGMRIERQHRAGKVQPENEQYTKTGHRRAHREKPGKRFLRLLFAEVFFVLLAAVLIISVIHLISDGKAAQAVKNLQRQMSVQDYKNVEKPEWEEACRPRHEFDRHVEEVPFV